MENKSEKPIRLRSGQAKIKSLFIKYEAKIALAAGLILVAVISFEAGALQGQNWQQKPLIIEKSAILNNTQEIPENPLKTQNLASESVSQELVAGDTTQKTPSNLAEAGPSNLAEAGPSNLAEAGPSNLTKVDCVFVGSKNSDKYHPPDCAWAKRIKPENIVCFKDAEDAKNKGYVPSSCVKR